MSSEILTVTCLYLPSGPSLMLAAKHSILTKKIPDIFILSSVTLCCAVSSQAGAVFMTEQEQAGQRPVGAVTVTLQWTVAQQRRADCDQPFLPSVRAEYPVM